MKIKNIAISGMLMTSLIAPAFTVLADEPASAVGTVPPAAPVVIPTNVVVAPTSASETNSGQIMKAAEMKVKTLRTEMDSKLKALNDEYKPKIEAVKADKVQAKALREERDIKLKAIRTDYKSQIEAIRKDAKARAEESRAKAKNERKAKKEDRMEKKAQVEKKREEIKDIRAEAKEKVGMKREEIKKIKSGYGEKPSVPPATPVAPKPVQ